MDAPPASDYGYLVARQLPYQPPNLYQFRKVIMLAVAIARDVQYRRLQLQLVKTSFTILSDWLESPVEGCPTSAPKGVDAPYCDDASCKGDSGQCTTGPSKHCACVEIGAPVFTHPVDQETLDYVKPDGPQDRLFDEISSFDPDPKVDCKQQRKTKRDMIPENYCECDGKNYVAVANEPDAACPYHTKSDLPDPLPVSKSPDDSDQIRIVVTQTQRISSVFMNNASVTLETASGSQLVDHPAAFTKTLSFRDKSFKGGIRMEAVTPDVDRYSKDSDRRFRQGIWYNVTYMPVPKADINDPAHKKSVIRWASNSADGKEPGVQFPGFGCDDLTAIPWKGHASGTSLVTRVFHCWFQPVL